MESRPTIEAQVPCHRPLAIFQARQARWRQWSVGLQVQAVRRLLLATRLLFVVDLAALILAIATLCNGNWIAAICLSALGNYTYFIGRLVHRARLDVLEAAAGAIAHVGKR